jgi:hypothetical protein
MVALSVDGATEHCLYLFSSGLEPLSLLASSDIKAQKDKQDTCKRTQHGLVASKGDASLDNRIALPID